MSLKALDYECTQPKLVIESWEMVIGDKLLQGPNQILMGWNHCLITVERNNFLGGHVDLHASDTQSSISMLFSLKLYLLVCLFDLVFHFQDTSNSYSRLFQIDKVPFSFIQNIVSINHEKTKI